MLLGLMQVRGRGTGRRAACKPPGGGRGARAGRLRLVWSHSRAETARVPWAASGGRGWRARVAARRRRRPPPTTTLRGRQNHPDAHPTHRTAWWCRIFWLVHQHDVHSEQLQRAAVRLLRRPHVPAGAAVHAGLPVDRPRLPERLLFLQQQHRQRRAGHVRRGEQLRARAAQQRHLPRHGQPPAGRRLEHHFGAGRRRCGHLVCGRRLQQRLRLPGLPAHPVHGGERRLCGRHVAGPSGCAAADAHPAAGHPRHKLHSDRGGAGRGSHCIHAQVRSAAQAGWRGVAAGWVGGPRERCRGRWRRCSRARHRSPCRRPHPPLAQLVPD